MDYSQKRDVVVLGLGTMLGFGFGINIGVVIPYIEEIIVPNNLELTCQELSENSKEVKIDGTPYTLKCDEQGRPRLYETKPAEKQE
ncbi:hypothetical protein GOV03_04475 [Candidatus Woesearchaeota archaeon]|nr:hypothetical protein [Candidatus Woesearchaeota archaeon]